MWMAAGGLLSKVGSVPLLEIFLEGGVIVTELSAWAGSQDSWVVADQLSRTTLKSLFLATCPQGVISLHMAEVEEN